MIAPDNTPAATPAAAATMTTIAQVTRTTDPDYPEYSSYAVTTTDGRTYTVVKEFYADGPSTFTWVISGPDDFHDEAPTKRAALVRIARTPVPAPPAARTTGS